jgi:hypothetical protein
MKGAYAPSLSPILDRLLPALRDALGDDLIGIYLYGSAVSGDFDPGVSDVDLVVVTRREVEDLDLVTLDQVHRGAVARSPAWSDRVELVYVSAATLASFRTSSGQLAVISPGEPFHVTGPVSDWLQNWYLVRREGIALSGPPPADVVPRIARSEYLEAIAGYLRYLRDQGLEDLSPNALAYTVLSACRAACTIEAGRPCSKQKGAAWVRGRRPEAWWVIDAALACRLSRGSVGFDDEETRKAAMALVQSLASDAPALSDQTRRPSVV